MSELKACPFCGSKDINSGGGDKVVFCFCMDCCATGPGHYAGGDWNTRPEEDRLRATNAELAGALREIGGNAKLSASVVCAPNNAFRDALHEIARKAEVALSKHGGSQ